MYTLKAICSHISFGALKSAFTSFATVAVRLASAGLSHHVDISGHEYHTNRLRVHFHPATPLPAGTGAPLPAPLPDPAVRARAEPARGGHLLIGGQRRGRRERR